MWLCLTVMADHESIYNMVRKSQCKVLELCIESDGCEGWFTALGETRDWNRVLEENTVVFVDSYITVNLVSGWVSS
jgi:hypothetical protein